MDIRERIKERFGAGEWLEKGERRVYFSVAPDAIRETARFLFKELGLRFSIASGMDTPAAFEILYHFSDDASGVMYSVRVRIPDKKDPEIDSIAPLFRGAEWIEREIWEMLGIKFRGHPELKRLLLADDWPEGEYPLRHDKKKD